MGSIDRLVEAAGARLAHFVGRRVSPQELAVATFAEMNVVYPELRSAHDRVRITGNAQLLPINVAIDGILRKTDA